MLATSDKCTGCTTCVHACPTNCISLIKNQFGFVYPHIDTALCLSCGKCKQICPVLSPKQINSENQTKAYAAYSTQLELREQSTSGGIFSLLANEILSLGGVVFGAAYDDNFGVNHIYIETREDLKKLRGAKYVESNLGDTFKIVKDFLQNERYVLFVGLPCQVAGLLSFLSKDYDRLLTVDLICHGVPAPFSWQQYIRYRSAIDNEKCPPKSINVRSKETGWSWYKYSIVFDYGEGKRYSSMATNDLFLQLFVGDYILRESCSSCKFKGYARCSDITLGDFWGIWNIDKTLDDNKGTSLVLSHTKKGEKFLSKLRPVIIKEKTLEEASRNNPALLCSVIHKPNRIKMLKVTSAGDYKKANKIFQQDKRIINKAYRFIRKRILKVFS